jgi:hypothetical protein
MIVAKMLWWVWNLIVLLSVCFTASVLLWTIWLECRDRYLTKKAREGTREKV